MKIYFRVSNAIAIILTLIIGNELTFKGIVNSLITYYFIMIMASILWETIGIYKNEIRKERKNHVRKLS